MIKKFLTLGIILLFVSVGIQPTLATNQYNVFFEEAIKQKINNYYKGEYISLYYANMSFYFEKNEKNSGSISGCVSTHPYDLYFNADLDELKIELIINYTAEMNYTLKWPFNFAPILAYGVRIQNISKYEWEYFKLKHHGYFKRTGNFSIVFDVDMSSVESGDLIIIQPILYSILFQDMEMVSSPDNINKSLICFIRFIYHIPIINRLLLTNWIFPILGNYKWNSFMFSNLYLYFI